MKNKKSINLDKARKSLRRSYMEEDDDLPVISEDLPILKEGEVSFPYENKNFAYVFGMKNFINFLESKGKVSISKPPNRKSKAEQLIILNIGKHTATFEKMKEDFLYVRNEDGENKIIIAHPIKRKVKLVNNDNSAKFKDDFSSVIGDYEKQLCVHCLLERVDKFLQGEWDKIHGSKIPNQVYRDRVDTEFPKSYKMIKYGKADRPAMKAEWDKIHGKRKDDYII